MDIKEIIKKYGYNIQQVADAMNVNRESLSRTISNNPTYKTMKKISEVLGCEVVEFFRDETKDADFAGYFRYKGIHYTADTLEEFFKQVDELKTIAR